MTNAIGNHLADHVSCLLLLAVANKRKTNIFAQKEVHTSRDTTLTVPLGYIFFPRNSISLANLGWFWLLLLLVVLLLHETQS